MKRINKTGVLLGILLILTFNTFLVQAQLNKSKPDAVEDVQIKEKLGSYLSDDIAFTNSEGKTVTTGDIFNGDIPVIINPVYYECPMLCSLVLNGLLDGVKELAWLPGKDYKIVTLSIDPDEGTQLAKQNKSNYIENFGRDIDNDGWYFLTGDSVNIKRLTESTGFGFKYVPEKNQYAHSAGIIFASPDRKITRYLYGIEYNEIDLKNALYETANGNIGNTIDKLVMYCYQYNPASNSYAPVAINIMKIGGALTLFFLCMFLGFFWYYDRKKRKAEFST